jgi:hypothetical protein
LSEQTDRDSSTMLHPLHLVIDPAIINLEKREIASIRGGV